MPATYEKIATTTLGSATSSISFGSISSAYTDLRLSVVLKNVSSDNPILRLNSDTGSNYSRVTIRGTGSAASSSNSASVGSINLGYNFHGASAQFAFYTIDLFAYTGSAFKTLLFTSSEDENGSGNVLRGVGLYRSTSVISTITLSNFSGNNFDTGTTATLYGILKA
jgi:hypothetical protein